VDADMNATLRSGDSEPLHRFVDAILHDVVGEKWPAIGVNE
jgi:hypothetical protein